MKWSIRCTAHQSVGIQSTTYDSYCQSNSSSLATVPHPTTHALTQVSCWTWFSKAFRWWMGGRQRHETDCNTNRNRLPTSTCWGVFFFHAVTCEGGAIPPHGGTMCQVTLESSRWGLPSVQFSHSPRKTSFSYRHFWFLTNTASLSLLGPFFIQLTFNRELSMCEEP